MTKLKDTSRNYCYPIAIDLWISLNSIIKVIKICAFWIFLFKDDFFTIINRTIILVAT